jgi:hypothetical protein
LTYALVEEGLKQAAADGGPKDDEVLVREWLLTISTPKKSATHFGPLLTVVIAKLQ